MKGPTWCSRALGSPVRQDLAQAVFLRCAWHFGHARAVWIHRVEMTIPAEGYLGAVRRPDGIFPILDDQLSIRAVRFYREDAHPLGGGILVEDYPITAGRPVRRVLLPFVVRYLLNPRAVCVNRVEVHVMRSEGFLVEDYLGTIRGVGGVSLSDLVAVNGRGVSEVLLCRAVGGVHHQDVFVFALAHEGYLGAAGRVGGIFAVRGATEVSLVGAVFGVHRVDLGAFLPSSLAHAGDLLAVGRVGGRGIVL